MCSLFTELRRLLLTLRELVGSSLVLRVICTSRSRPSAFSGFSWEFGVALFALRALHGAWGVRPDLIGGTEAEAWDCFRACCKTEKKIGPLRSHGPLWTSKTTADRTSEIQLRLSTLPHSCHAASISVAVWARTSAQIGRRRQLTISFL